MAGAGASGGTVPEAVYGGAPEKDTRMTVTAADKKANTPAYQRVQGQATSVIRTC